MELIHQGRTEGRPLRRFQVLRAAAPEAAHKALSPSVLEAWPEGATPEACRRHAEKFFGRSSASGPDGGQAFPFVR